MDDLIGFLVVLVVAATVGLFLATIFWIFLGVLAVWAALGAIVAVTDAIQRRRLRPARMKVEDEPGGDQQRADESEPSNGSGSRKGKL